MTDRDDETPPEWVAVVEAEADEDAEPVTWVYPRADRGVWLLFADGRDGDGTSVRLVRAFSIEPSDAVVRRQAETLYDQIPDGLKLTVFRIGLDVYDAEEVEAAGC